MKKILRIAIGLTLALGLVIGIALPGLAAPNEAEGKALIPRKVAALVRHRVELKQQMRLKPQKQGEHNPLAKLKLRERSCRFGEEAIFDDIAVGARVKVRNSAGGR